MTGKDGGGAGFSAEQPRSRCGHAGTAGLKDGGCVPRGH